MESIAERLRRLRVAAGLTQSQLSSSAVSASFISLVEAGKRVPGPEVVAYLAGRLGCTSEYLSRGEEGAGLGEARQELAFVVMAMANGQWRVALDRVRAISVEGLPEDLRFEVRATLGRAFEAVGDLESAVSTLSPLLEAAAEEGRHLRWLQLANSVAGCYLESADLHEAGRIAREALHAAREADLTTTDKYMRLLATLSWVMYEQGDLLAARDLLHGALSSTEAGATPLARGSLYWNASLVADGRGHHDDAQELAQRAMALMAEHASQRDIARLRVHYSHLLVSGPHPLPQVALEHAERAEQELRLVASTIDVADCMTESARALLLLGRTTEAEQQARASLQMLETPSAALGDGRAPRLEAVSALIVLAECQEVLGDDDGAAATYEQAATTLSMLRIGRRAASLWRDIAERLQRRGDLQGALRAFGESLNAAGVSSTLNTDSPRPMRDLLSDQ